MLTLLLVLLLLLTFVANGIEWVLAVCVPEAPGCAFNVELQRRRKENLMKF